MSTEHEAQVTQTLERLHAADDLDTLEAIRVEALGKQGWLNALMKTLGKMSPEERQTEGPRLQGMRARVADAIEDRKAVLEAAALEAKLATEVIDLTLPAPQMPQGSVHPVSQVMDELAEIFADLGFAVATGPEIEDEWHNFTALNMAETHPARAEMDTFYFPDRDADGNRMLLRTHTSPVQIRTMVGEGAPVRIIAPTATRPTRRCSTRSKGSRSTATSIWAISSGRWRPSSRRSSSATTSCCACARPTSPSPNLRSKSMSAIRMKAVAAWSVATAMPKAMHGWNCSAAAWSTRG